MRIVVTGRAGQVVSCLLEAAQKRSGVSVIPVGRPQFDLSSVSSVAPAIEAANPDVVVSAAAYTAVNLAEDNVDIAFQINRDGAGAVSAAAFKLNVPVIYLSTDYVFSGAIERPYRETDRADPVNVYGASKLAGEGAVARANPRHIVLRTAWVFSVFGANFVRTMLRRAETKNELGVVADQLGNPTSGHDLANAILDTAIHVAATANFHRWGVYHLAGQGDASWADLAEATFSFSREFGGQAASVRRIASAEFPTKASRPPNSRLDCSAFAREFNRAPPDWRESLRAVVHRLVVA